MVFAENTFLEFLDGLLTGLPGFLLLASQVVLPHPFEIRLGKGGFQGDLAHQIQSRFQLAFENVERNESPVEKTAGAQAGAHRLGCFGNLQGVQATRAFVQKIGGEGGGARFVHRIGRPAPHDVQPDLYQGQFVFFDQV